VRCALTADVSALRVERDGHIESIAHRRCLGLLALANLPPIGCRGFVALRNLRSRPLRRRKRLYRTLRPAINEKPSAEKAQSKRPLTSLIQAEACPHGQTSSRGDLGAAIGSYARTDARFRKLPKTTSEKSSRGLAALPNLPPIGCRGLAALPNLRSRPFRRHNRLLHSRRRPKTENHLRKKSNSRNRLRRRKCEGRFRHVTKPQVEAASKSEPSTQPATMAINEKPPTEKVQFEGPAALIVAACGRQAPRPVPRPAAR
jgi:hypothetical protein